ncbi:hypothetical protein [Rhizobium gallicum]|uniref:hypothetical protein n=1 Tax=Rhizobium gallicum TaxID=56730 RepID=UPI000A481A2C|nr:hypothetical protein [Rhizobium gallicum]
MGAKHRLRFSSSMAASMRFDAPETLAVWAGQVGLVPFDTETVADAGFLFIAEKWRAA